MDKLKDPKFKQRVMELMDEEIIHKFENKTGSAESFYDIDQD